MVSYSDALQVVPCADAFEEYRLACWTILHAILSIVTDTLLWVCRYMKGRIRSLECVSSAFRKGAICPACPKARVPYVDALV